ncbi:MAG: hypothetical protein ACPGU7_05235 [Gammaproteobacteria bacterium]
MEVTKTLAAGKEGTKRYLRQYGDRLVCVRHRRGNGRRWTTVEIIVDERPDDITYRIVPPEERPIRTDLPDPPPLIAIQVAINERGLRETVKTNGGRWDPKLKVWWMTRAAVRRLGLRDRVVPV